MRVVNDVKLQKPTKSAYTVKILVSQSHASKKPERLYQHIDSFFSKATRQCCMPFPPCSNFDSNIRSSGEVTVTRMVLCKHKIFEAMRFYECQGTQKRIHSVLILQTSILETGISGFSYKNMSDIQTQADTCSHITGDVHVVAHLALHRNF